MEYNVPLPSVYKEFFPKCLKDYLSQHEAFVEVDFIHREIERFKRQLRNLTDNSVIKEDERTHIAQVKAEYPEIEVNEMHEIIQLSVHRRMAIASCERIIEFLEEQGQQDDHTEVPTKKTKEVLLNGQKINLRERYIIADRLFKLDTEIRKLNIPDGKKYEILSVILGCNETNARLIMNGNYKAHVKESEIDNYIESLIDIKKV